MGSARRPRGCSLDLPRGSAKALGGKGRVPVTITVDGQTFRVSAFPDGKGGHTLNFNKAMQAASAWASRKRVSVPVEADTAPRMVAVPKDLKATLAKAPDAKSASESLSPSHRRGCEDWIEGAKRPGTRDKRVNLAVDRLSKGEKFWD